MEKRMINKAEEFRKTLERYINYRGIDIVLHLKDGSVIELDKNRNIDGDTVIKNSREGAVVKIAIERIQRADFFAA